MADTVARIRADIDALAASKHTRRYPPELKARIAAFARRQLDAGARVSVVAKSLDMAPQTLERIISEEPTVGLVPVRVLEAPAPPRLVVRAPCGIVVEGLDVSGVAELIRALS